MNIHPAVIVGIYFLIGIFIASAFEHYDGQSIADDAGIFAMIVFLWPIVLGALVAIFVLWVPYILGKWTGHLLQDLVRSFK